MRKLSSMLLFFILCVSIQAKNISSVKKYEQILNPSVQVHVGEGVGSGVLIDRKSLDKNKYKYSVITVRHNFVHNNNTIELALNKKCLISTYINKDKTDYIGVVVKESHDLDLCLVEFISKNKIKHIASTPNKKMVQDLRVFDPIYVVGCQAGFQPIVTSGIISLIHPSNDKFITNAEVYFGSSGGGAFQNIDGNYYLIGICQAMWSNGSDNLCHISIFVSAKKIIEFIKS